MAGRTRRRSGSGRPARPYQPAPAVELATNGLLELCQVMLQLLNPAAARIAGEHRSQDDVWLDPGCQKLRQHARQDPLPVVATPTVVAHSGTVLEQLLLLLGPAVRRDLPRQQILRLGFHRPAAQREGRPLERTQGQPTCGDCKLHQRRIGIDHQNNSRVRVTGVVEAAPSQDDVSLGELSHGPAIVSAGVGIDEYERSDAAGCAFPGGPRYGELLGFIEVLLVWAPGGLNVCGWRLHALQAIPAV